VWIARILLTWGILATLTGLVRNVQQLYVLRFLLGLAEAGYFPGMVLYLTYWFRPRERAQAVAFLVAALPVASIVGAPISGVISDHVNWLHLAGWRWLLILEGAPAIVLGFLTYVVLPNRPADAKFLSGEEKEWIGAELLLEEKAKLEDHTYSILQALANRRVWYMGCIHFGVMIGLYTLSFWVPQLIKALSATYSNSLVGLLVMLPHLVGLAAMIAWSRNSDRTLERRYHAAIPPLLAGVALVVMSRTHSALLLLVLVSILAAGIYSYTGPFWTLPNEFLTGFSAAAGIALINSIGNLGGFAGPYLIGFISERTGTLAGFAAAGVPLMVSAAMLMRLPKRALSNQPPGTPPSEVVSITARPGVA
jgi:ACS family tartrate transporter-like MFS transporter